MVLFLFEVAENNIKPIIIYQLSILQIEHFSNIQANALVPYGCLLYAT